VSGVTAVSAVTTARWQWGRHQKVRHRAGGLPASARASQQGRSRAIAPPWVDRVVACDQQGRAGE
ncbi:MAG: hypothetical protein LC790_01610, partial [Actinobacteria bacterium]|nr:hypothetical protein [Actinomycetota bacterium]